MVRNRRLRLIISAASIMLPWALRRRLLNWLLGYQLSPSARIGFSVVAVSRFCMGKNASIGHLSVCRGLAELEIEDYGHIGNLNWITGDDVHPLHCADSVGPAKVSLSIGAHSAITNRHYIDCSGGISIGVFTTVAGIRSQLLTHSIDLNSCIQQVKQIVIGDYCFVGTGCIILSGARLPSYSVLGAGSLLRSAFDREWTLYAGVPAKAEKDVPAHYKYFHRISGVVD